jgi:soluble lytic murein transglycosylase-like protein
VEPSTPGGCCLRRTLLAILAVLGFALVSGSRPSLLSSDDLRGAGDSARPDAARIAAIMRRVNPVLSGAESERIGHAVARSSERFSLDPELVTAVLLVESGGRPWARSPKGALGLMQVMPHMTSGMRIAGSLMTIESNIEAGCWILAENIRRLGEADGISAYFWGSDIRGVAYLDRVRAARAAIRRFSES